MRAKIRDTEIYFDVEGIGLVPDGRIMREKPLAFVIHGGPGGDHSSFKPAFSPLAERMQHIYLWMLRQYCHALPNYSATDWRAGSKSCPDVT